MQAFFIIIVRFFEKSRRSGGIPLSRWQKDKKQEDIYCISFFSVV